VNSKATKPTVEL